jgi:hypothetical protein
MGIRTDRPPTALPRLPRLRRHDARPPPPLTMPPSSTEEGRQTVCCPRSPRKGRVILAVCRCYAACAGWRPDRSSCQPYNEGCSCSTKPYSSVVPVRARAEVLGHRRRRRSPAPPLTTPRRPRWFAQSLRRQRRTLLETGRDSTEALAIYARFGYEPIAPYAPGHDSLINRALA